MSNLARVVQELPQLGWRAGISREATPHADDGDGLVSVGSHDENGGEGEGIFVE